MQSALINNGHDLHLHEGPIDLVISASGSAKSVDIARAAAASRFETVLSGLVSELVSLRKPLTAERCGFRDPTARRMHAATRLFANTFITPMASVAGAVADEVLASMVKSAPDLLRISVNNGGDIALWLAPQQKSTVGIADPVTGEMLARAEIKADQHVGGIATSGRPGRSLSLGIADSVTVLACNAAIADAAATLIANTVDLADNKKVNRVAARALDPDSDLGDRLATVQVDKLTGAECAQALNHGLCTAHKFYQQGLITAAYLVLQGRYVTTQTDATAMSVTQRQQISREYDNA